MRLGVLVRSGLERPARAGESPVGRVHQAASLSPSTAGHEEPCGNLGGPPPKAKYALPPIVHQYREGKAKRTPEGE